LVYSVRFLVYFIISLKIFYLWQNTWINKKLCGHCKGTNIWILLNNLCSCKCKAHTMWSKTKHVIHFEPIDLPIYSIKNSSCLHWNWNFVNKKRMEINYLFSCLCCIALLVYMLIVIMFELVAFVSFNFGLEFNL
jgi:hypothetical protein